MQSISGAVRVRNSHRALLLRGIPTRAFCWLAPSPWLSGPGAHFVFCEISEPLSRQLEQTPQCSPSEMPRTSSLPEARLSAQVTLKKHFTDKRCLRPSGLRAILDGRCVRRKEGAP